MKYAVVIESGENNYSAYVPDLPGCVACGQSTEEVRALIEEAVGLHIESMRAHGETVPAPTTTVDRVRAWLRTVRLPAGRSRARYAAPPRTPAGIG